jgi:LysM repeat protein
MEPSPQTAEPQTFSSEGSAGEPRYHAVKSGETLFRIAKRYGRSVSQLKEWNRLPDTNIEVGQRLIVGFD